MAPTAVSPATAAANAFVAEHLAAATALGGRLGDRAGDPAAFARELESGLRKLADPAVVDGMRVVAPGIGPVIGVRLPLLTAAHRAFRRATRRTSSAQILDVTDLLLRAEISEIRWFGMWNLEGLLATDPERTWQLMRRAAGAAAEWISVDTLAHPFAAGILREPRRWAELQGLAFSQSRWERRLVGSTLATLPHVRLGAGRNVTRRPVADDAVVVHGLGLIGQLIGDNEPDVQKALSWAIRTMAALDSEAVADFLDRETEIARAGSDGNRAWVIRDSLIKLPEGTAAALRARLEGIRRRPGAAPTSRAAATAAAFMPNLNSGTAPRPIPSPMEA